MISSVLCSCHMEGISSIDFELKGVSGVDFNDL